MAAYVIADIEVTDPEGYAEYRSQTAATVEKYDGRFLARGGDVMAVEGTWSPSRLIIIEFPSSGRLRLAQAQVHCDC